MASATSTVRMNHSPLPLSPTSQTAKLARAHWAALLAAVCSLSFGVEAQAANPWDSQPGSLARFEEFSRQQQLRNKPKPKRAPRPQAQPPASFVSFSTAVQDARVAPVMLRASVIANQRALSHSTAKCWRFVKTALLQAGSVASYPQTVYAKEAGRELVQNYGFVKLAVRNPSRAPVGSVLVYGGRGAGHVELRTTTGFVSDYRSRKPAGLPFIGAFAKVADRTALVVGDGVPRS